MMAIKRTENAMPYCAVEATFCACTVAVMTMTACTMNRRAQVTTKVSALTMAVLMLYVSTMEKVTFERRDLCCLSCMSYFILHSGRQRRMQTKSMLNLKRKRKRNSALHGPPRHIHTYSRAILCLTVGCYRGNQNGTAMHQWY